MAGELILSFVPDPEQRLWRTMSRTKHPWTRDRVRLYSQLESLLEDGRIQLATGVTDLLGVRSRRMLRGLAEGETDPPKLAARADPNRRATPEQRLDARAAAPPGSALHREMIGLFLQPLERIENPIQVRNTKLAPAWQTHRDAVERWAEVPGYGADAAPPVMAEIGPTAATFSAPPELASWVGVCPGREESAEVSANNRSPKGNRMRRRVRNQVAHAAGKSQGSIFDQLYRRFVWRMGHNKAIWAIAHRFCRLTWKILHAEVRDIEFGNRANPQAVRQRAAKLIRHLRVLGYPVQLQPAGGKS